MEEIITIEKKAKKKKAPFIAGLFVIALAIVGIVSIVSFIIDKASPEVDTSADTKEYAKFLTWVIGVDPEPFSDIATAGKDDLRNIALCTLLNDEVTTSTYNVTEKGLVVPASDVENKFTAMFGTETAIVHGNVVGYGYEFLYDASAGVYYVPLTGVTPPFSVRIENVKTTGDLIELRVGYVGTDNVQIDSQGNLQAAQPDKYADITLKKAGDSFNLISLVYLSAGERQ